MPSKSFVFVSYARTDSEPVQRIVAELRKLGVDVWIDAEMLTPGESWELLIKEALRRASAILVFISPESVASHWIAIEFAHAVESGVKVLPILLHPTPLSALPLQLQMIHWLDVTKFPTETTAQSAAQEIAKVLFAWEEEAPALSLPDREREGLAKALARQTGGQANLDPDDDKPPSSVFIVHGHDESFLDEVVAFVRNLGIATIVMKEIEGAATSLIEKFFKIGGEAKFAIVLLSADDMGASRLQYEEPGVTERSLKFRSRQNVVLELGFFYGFLGWDKVFVLEKSPPQVFPDYERPSDLNGVLFDRFDESGKWKNMIRTRMANAGFKIAAK